MTRYVAIDVSQLSPWEEGSNSALWWGTAVFAAAISTVYAALIASYFYLRQDSSGWPPGNIEVPALFWPVVGTAVRTAAEPCMILASKFTREGNRTGLLVSLGVAIILLIGWMVEIVEYAFSRSFGWTFGTYESLTWVLEAFPFIVGAALVIWGIVVWIKSLTGHFTPERRVGIQCLKLFWTSQFIAWIFIWMVVYFGPRVFYKV